MEKAFALADQHPHGKGIAVYATLDERVRFIVSTKPIDWPERDKQEVTRCPRCKAFMFSRRIGMSRGEDWRHTCTMKPKAAEKEPVPVCPPEKEVPADVAV
jgi:hypothetical protein